MSENRELEAELQRQKNIVAIMSRRIADQEAKMAGLKLRATAVVEDNQFLEDKKPRSADYYGVNAKLLWLLKQELEACDGH